MAHQSEGTHRLERRLTRVDELQQLELIDTERPGVYLLLLPAHRSDADHPHSTRALAEVAQFCGRMHPESTFCVLTTPADAARLLPALETAAKFQLWITVKTAPVAFESSHGQLRQHHAALLVLTRYRGSLRHAKTRIAYTYCPACGKTTKDYGGKKHVYHEYGTLMSDVWRDLDCHPSTDVAASERRLADLFGIALYSTLHSIDLRGCSALAPRPLTLAASVLEPGAVAARPALEGLRNGDCLAELAAIPDNSVDFCFADPPYNVQKTYDRWDDALESAAYFAWCDRWLTELHRVLKPGHTLAVLNIPHWAVRHYEHLCRFMDFQAWIAWEGLSLPVRMIMPAHYAVLCFSKGRPRPLPGLEPVARDPAEVQALQPLREFYCLRAACADRRERGGTSDRAELTDLWWDIHRLKHNSKRTDHPCQLPPLLMRRLFALFTEPGELVLDPFNGAGTSTLVAQQLRRRHLGIELSPHYHEIAVGRHATLSAGGDPFGKNNAVPAAKNSRVPRMQKQPYLVSKKTLQLEVRRIARLLGRLPNRDEVSDLSRYPFAFFDEYFVSWGEVCAAARTTGMSELPEGRGTEATPDRHS